ncbi:glycine zipper domain-containing protein [Litorimonas sp. RW-G-Af-16]|uniref:glycine zipper domain-containing protein n=1 Tax=Litorimonas sp. RW-G-Af-16 TaxID=3241168 RepID=UPI00390C729F
MILSVASVSLIGLSACTTTGNVEKNAAIGAAAGAVAGAVIGNNTGSGDAGTGAAIGAIVGGAGGAYAGQQKDKNMNEPTVIKRGADGQELIYDQQAGRYYYYNAANGRTYWRDGSYRG